MAQLDEKHVAIARVYARAMLDLAAQQDAAETLAEELRDLRQLLDQEPRLGTYLKSPLVEVEERREMLEKTFRGRASDLLVDSLQVLNRKGRLPILETVIETYRSELQTRQRRVDVSVTTAVPLTDDERAAIRALVERQDGRRPELIESVDPSLLGGMVLRIDDRKIDTSVAKDLRVVRARLAERGSHEIVSGRLQAATE